MPTPKRKTRLLALSLSPKTGSSILDWRPFAGGRKLSELIDDHNKRCIDSFRQRGWLPEDIETIAEYIDVVPHDLRSVDSLVAQEFADIRILLVDLSVIETILAKIDTLKARMSRQQHMYLLPQIAPSSDTPSQVLKFSPLPVVSSDPEVILTEAGFVDFLGKLCHLYHSVVNTISPAPPPAGGSVAGEEGREADLSHISRIASDVRDAAIARKLSPSQTRVLAHRVDFQERFLSRITDRLYVADHKHIVVDALRKTAIDIPLKMSGSNEVEKKGLIKLNLVRPLNELRSEQRRMLDDLGVRGIRYSTVHFDEKHIRNKVKSLGGIVKVRKFSADLPGWVGLKGSFGE